MKNTIIVTGGAGFIGSNFVHRWIEMEDASVINLDKLTYAGNLGSLQAVSENRRYQFVHGDICDQELLRRVFDTHAPRAVVHFAAVGHVDRSILGPAKFVRTNIEGPFDLLVAARCYSASLDPVDRA